jgi:hypothetical protein
MAEKRVWPQTISNELFEAWKRHARHGDVKQMCEDLQSSHPVIVRALKYGYVASADLPDKINGFFVNRLQKEKNAAQEMNRQAAELEELKPKKRRRAVKV